MTIIILIVSAVVYVVSGFLMWLYIKIAYSKGGIYYSINADKWDVFFTLCPLLNIIGIFIWFGGVHTDKNKEYNRCNKFFKIKK